MRKRECWTCGGKGYIVDWLAALFSGWGDFQKNAYKRCDGCGGSGWYWERWQDYGRKYRRR